MPKPAATGPVVTAMGALPLLAAAVCWGSGGLAFAEKPAAAKPNIVFLLADDLGYGDVGCYNPGAKIPTPNLDRLAARGIRFTDAHDSAAVCTPSRYGILTGRYCWRTRLKSGVLMGFDAPLIEPGRMTVASLLKQHGYATACIGKWHVGMTFTKRDGTQVSPQEHLQDGSRIDFSVPIKNGPRDAGFDYFFGCAACPANDWLYAMIENDRTVGTPSEKFPGFRGGLRANRPGLKTPDFDFETLDVTFAAKSVKFMAERVAQGANRPFFLYHALAAPHLPAIPAQQFVGKTALGPLGDYIYEVDWVAGQIIDAVDRLGIAENTLIIVTSDNGPETCAWDLQRQYGHRSAAGLRGWKRDNWEGGHRVPLIARWPGKIRPGTTSDEDLCLTDLLATAAALVGTALPDDAGEDSYNMLPALLGEKLPGPIREATVHHSCDGLFAIRQGKWKLIAHPGSGSWNYRDGRLPIEPPLTEPDAPGQLYDLSTDPGETKNLYREQPEIVRRLSALLEKYRAEGRSRPWHPAHQSATD